MWIDGQEDAVEAVDAGQLAEDLLANQDQNAKDDGNPKRKRKKLLAEIEAVTGILESQAAAGDGGVTADLLRQRVQDMQGALSELGSGAADEDAWSSSSGSDADEATAAEAPVGGPAGEAAKRGEAAAAAARAAEQLQGGLVETERERQVRLGLITPFQNLPGLSRGIVRRGADAEDDDKAAAERAHKCKLERSAEYLRQSQREEEEVAPRTRVLDPAQLTDEELRPTERHAYFMPRRSGGQSGDRAAAKVMADRRKQWRAAAHSTPRRDREGEAPEATMDDRDDADSDYFKERVAELELEWAPQGDAAVRSAVLSADRPASRPASPARRAPDGDAAAAAAVDVVTFDGGFQLPASLFSRLFPYQQVGVQWLWELHLQRAGGIMGDEMGLGKTIQLICFLGGLHFSGKHRPALVVAPVTTLQHWLRELHTWYPHFRVIKLHNSNMKLGDKREVERYVAKARRSGCGVILTGYEVLRRHADVLLPLDWGYVVLDEGHKISNPDAEITLLCKQVRTAHRVILSGTPIQNRLTELWSLFDFVFPGKLGTLPVFQGQFGLPIQQGTYANASAVAVTAAYKCAVMLRDMMSPYLLRRTKADVAKQLPKKTEQVLLCSLSPQQRKLYQGYLGSREVADILDGKRPAMEGITILRKICNHADLLHRADLLTSTDPTVDYGALPRSSKLQLTMQVLEKWRAGGHKALLFTQTQQMLDIIERHVADAGMRYLRMDGSVPPQHRFRMIDHFNRHPASGVPPAAPSTPPASGDEADPAVEAPTAAGADAHRMTPADAGAMAALASPPSGGGAVLRSSTQVQPADDAPGDGEADPSRQHGASPSADDDGGTSEPDADKDWHEGDAGISGEEDSSEDDFDGCGGGIPAAGSSRPRHRPRKKRRRAVGGTAAPQKPARARQPRTRHRDDGEDDEVFVFLLTTKVGGLGVNLTAADRVLLFDPDWNPSTDIQARERSWRLGQKRPVTIFRLITRGTIEEKVYHRQIYKHALSTRVLTDPRQKRFVAQSGLRELFALTDKRHGGDTETGRLWQQLGGGVVDRADAEAAASPAGATSTPGSPRSGAATPVGAGPAADGASAAPAAAAADVEAAPAPPDGANAGETGEARLLQELFAGTEGLHSALDHSAMERAGGAAQRDVERLAAAVAKQAAAALAASREARQQDSVHIPTWTGKAGEGGAPSARPRFGTTARGGAGRTARGAVHAGRGAGSGDVSSAAVIARLKARDREHAEGAPAADAAGQEQAAKAQEVLAQVVSFLSTQPGGAAPSEQILTEFATAAEGLGPVLFRQTLKQAAALDKRRGQWVLRPAFK
eukprot:jgi/Ulvmu1/9758/UM055_0098.1